VKAAAIVVAGLLILGALAWNAAEMHYENCVEAARARTPLSLSAAEQGEVGGLTAEELLNPEEAGRAEDRIRDAPRRRRAAAVEGCSRLPW
jgi:hypothetical protein